MSHSHGDEFDPTYVVTVADEVAISSYSLLSDTTSTASAMSDRYGSNRVVDYV